MILAEFADPNSRVVVAREADGAVLGFVVYWLFPYEAHIADIAVAPAARRGGIGKALVAEAIRGAREAKSEAMILDVRTANEPAIALYRAAAFADLGVRPRYYANGDDALVMKLSLT